MQAEILTIRIPKGTSRENAKAELKKLNYEIIEIGEQPSVKVSQKALEAINSGLEEAKKGIFIDNDQVLEETDQLIEALAKKWIL
ncbi:hypothetical protein HMPREF1551_02805 [Capnocytophaga sp. oral taxon 863 str. F0517]|jgi:hypothetical protein|uniref:hypothetical protein n=1 Tax=Capnocytophaga sp. oral taxon 863 TaxID=1227265 RepID=UPI0003983928|nr:hypothetical protein [Capnocytophaga sp. oral taxon 863]ERI61217.1 hypothetical protein HMPREF1551_02805 [Capnocytophaga sp. oral taxon 863 str. F0517]